MNYKVNKFNIILTREFEELQEKEIKATKIINMKPSFYEEFNKKRHFYKLESFNYFNNILTKDLFEVIAFVNCLIAFNGNYKKRFEMSIKNGLKCPKRNLKV